MKDNKNLAQILTKLEENMTQGLQLIHQLLQCVGEETKVETNKKYYKMHLVIQPQEMFVDGKYAFISRTEKTAILHEAQKINPHKFDKIKELMFSDLCNEKHWDSGNIFKNKKGFSFNLEEIPWKSEPITYNI